MTKVAFRGLAQRKLRGIVTVLAVLLGVAFIAGSYVLTDTINRSFDDIFDVAYAGTDVAISSSTTGQADNGADVPPFSERYLDRVRKVPGVEKAAGGIFSTGRFVDAKGDTLGHSFAPQFISSTAPKPFETLTYTEGRPPQTADEASIDVSTADREGLKVGGTLRIAADAGVKAYRITGLQRLGNTSSGGAGTAQLTLPEAQRITDKQGQLDGISVKAASGASPRVLRERIDRVLPPRLVVETGTQAAARQAKDIKDDLKFFRVVLLVFGGVALLVGSFLIFNTFAITVAQRIRELGLLRAIGATRGQILRGMILEAATIGLIGSLLGVFAGIGFAAALNAIFKSFGIDLPNTGTVVEARTFIVSIVVGMVVTLGSALTPALRATRVSPMAALREAELPEGRRHGRIFTAVAVLFALGGIGLTCLGLFAISDSDAAAAAVGGGAVATLFGVAMFSPRLVRPLASLSGWPLERLRGITGRLARENAVRKPGRTAVTAGALMIGLAVVVFVTVFAAGISASVSNAIDRNFQGDLVLQNSDGFSPISPGAARAAEKADGVRTVSSLSFGGARYKGNDVNVSGVDPAKVSDVLSLDWKKGSPATLASLSRRGAVADDAWAKSNDLDVGDKITVRTPLERNVTYTIEGTVKDNADLLGNFVISEEQLHRQFGVREPSFSFVALDPGANAETVKREVKSLVDERFPTVDTLNQKELKDNQEQQINQLVGFFYVLLALAIVISLLGIVTTLALSIHERTRELGMLRAVGMSRRQVRRLVRYESVITALIGAILGTILGVIFASLMALPLSDEGFELAYPIGTLITLLVLAALAGVLAAIWPARRAAKLDVLQALAYE